MNLIDYMTFTDQKIFFLYDHYRIISSRRATLL